MGHVQELRRRLFYVVGFLLIFSGLGFLIREQLIEYLVRPVHDQQFIYTSPVGGFDFIFRISLYFGIVLSVPVLMYNLFQFLAPLLRQRSGGFVLKATLFSYMLAIAGLAFGYFASLPAALNFLLNQFNTGQIQALLSIQEYMSFVIIYLVGFALLFQIPLVMLFINRIKPLKPSQLMGYQRFVVVGSAVLAAILTPTADIINMLIMAVPIILMYQIGMVLVLLRNHRRKAPRPTPDPLGSEPIVSSVAPILRQVAVPPLATVVPMKPRPLNQPNVIQ